MAVSVAMALLCLILILQLAATYLGLYYSFSSAGEEKLSERKFIVAFSTLVFSLFYTLFISKILSRFERRYGYFMENAEQYPKIVKFVWTIFVIWIILTIVSVFVMWNSFIVVGPSLLLNAVATTMIPLALYWQKKTYDADIDQIHQDNAKVGQSLSYRQAHAIYKIKKYKQKIGEPGNLKDSYRNNFDNGRVKALQAVNYYKMQKWMQLIKNAAEQGEDCTHIRNMYNEMGEHCETFDLGSDERQNIQELAQMENVVIEPNANRQQKLPNISLCTSSSRLLPPKNMPHRGSKTSSYLDLRRISDAPPSYRSYQSSFSDVRSGSNV